METTSQTYDYFTAFQRNLGFLSKAEQQKLRDSRVAVVGLGGTGGAQVHALSRLGIGAFQSRGPGRLRTRELQSPDWGDDEHDRPGEDHRHGGTGARHQPGGGRPVVR
ncbi:MAG: ThiF family adenylyltransferase [Betaproteobacteria bacterium]|nr:ThiF family adenylyltransferase [Betaproteobacteria bacterium]